MTAGDRLFHVALSEAWSAAARRTEYRASTLGRSLDEEGFTHCCRSHQVAGVLARFYTGVAAPLVLVEIDPGRLTSPVVEEVPPGGAEAFPHVYGVIDAGAVVAVHPVPGDGNGGHLPPAVVSAGSDRTGPSR